VIEEEPMSLDVRKIAKESKQVSIMHARLSIMASRRKQIQERLEAVLATLSITKLAQVADFAEYLKSREEWQATVELMNDPAMRGDVEEGRAQAARGDGRTWREIQPRVRG